MPRAVLPHLPHHVTQRGVNRQAIFLRDADRSVYLQLVLSAADRFGLTMTGYCLMPNHVHWIVIPSTATALAQAFGEAHGKYAHYANALRDRSGHFWQNRFFSCVLERSHVWVAMRYVERNPVRAALVGRAEDWLWSSAAVHMGLIAAPPWLDLRDWQSTFSIRDWREFLSPESLTEAEIALRRSTYTGRPFGSADFVANAGAQLGRVLESKQGGRPKKDPGVATSGNISQMVLPYEA